MRIDTELSWLKQPPISFVRKRSSITLEQATEFAAYSFLPDGEPTGDPPRDLSSPPPPELSRYVSQQLTLKHQAATAEEIMSWWNAKVRAEQEERTAASEIRSVQNETRRALGLSPW